MADSTHDATKIKWKQVWGIAILQSAISFSWLVYYFAQPRILQQFDFSHLVGPFFIAVGVLGLLIEPLVGYYSDTVKRKLGSRFPVINAGIYITSMIFLTVAFGLQVELPPAIAWIVPALMFLWMASMKLFQTPSISLLWRMAPPKDLPQATSVLILVSGLVGATGPFINGLLDTFSFALTFLLGGVILFISGTLMKRMTANFKQAPEPDAASTPLRIDGRTIGKVFLIGFCAQVITAPIYYVVPLELHTRLYPHIPFNYITAAVLLASALAAVPIGRWASKVGVRTALPLGLTVMTALFGLISLNHGLGAGYLPVLLGFLIVTMGACLALIYSSSIPFALSFVDEAQSALATGLYFGGGGAAFAAISTVSYFSGPPSVWMMLVAAVPAVVVTYLIMQNKK